jgi:leader peptidase (prepilin peptidase)/N-methyltransferase
MEWPLAITTAALLAALAALAIIDARTLRLPDKLTLPLIAAGLAAAWASGAPVWLHLLGAVLGYLSLVVIEKGYLKVRGRAGLGRGDAKLFAAGGAWCGALALPLILLVASASALLYVLVMRVFAGRRLQADLMIAFGPFLAFAIGLIFLLQAAGLTRLAGL